MAMSKNIHIHKGLNIRLEGMASEKKTKALFSEYIALKPADFTGITPKLMVKEGDRVKAGDPIFVDKHQPEMVVAASVSGTIAEIKRGAQRKIVEILIKADTNIEYTTFAPILLSDNAEKIRKDLQNSGFWPFIKQRPFDIIARVDSQPKAIFVTAFDTNPLAPKSTILLQEQESYFQAGLSLLSKMAMVHLSIHEELNSSPFFLQLKDVTLHTFSGQHPSGNVGVQIHHIEPINKGEVVWTLDLFGVLAIGRRFKDNKYDVHRTITLVGSEIKDPAYIDTVIGASLPSIVGKNNVYEGDLRYISGNPLTGDHVGEKGYLGFYHQQVTVLPEGHSPKFFLSEGWLSLGFNRFSNSRLYPTFLFPKKRYALDTNLNGEERAFVVTGELEKVFPFDILPMQIIKSAMYQDIEEMENLGIYEVAPEDFALCEYVCTSKINIQEIIRKGLDLVQQS